MANVLWTAPLGPMSPNAGVAVTAAALTAGTPLPAPIIPGGTLLPGSELDIIIHLEMTSTSATPTLTIGLYIGAVGNAIGSQTLIAATGANALSASAAAWPIIMRYRGTIRATSGSAGVIHGQGELLYGTSLTAWTSSPYPLTAAARTVSTLNTQQSNQLDVGITLSATTGSPSVTVTDFEANVSG